MFITNDSLLSAATTSVHVYLNSTIDASDILSSPPSSSGIILTIIILSFLSISGWIFMSYALFGRSEAYRTKPDDPFSSTHSSDRTTATDFTLGFD